MRISELTLENFKGFNGEHKFNFEHNLTFFVGNNNTGKSSTFEAVDFIKNGIPKGKSLNDIKSKGSKGDLIVTVELQEDIKDVIENFSEKKYLSYVYDKNGTETILAQRSSVEREIVQNGKKVKIDIKKVTLWNPDTKQFENPTGIDRVFGTLFESQFVWADTNPDDISDFGSTKICGRLLSGAIGDFFSTPLWEEFVNVHDKTFHSGPDSLTSRTKSLEKEINSVIQDQYGQADVSFNFQLPEASNFLKSGGINIDDGTETSSREKGTGLQRALALALIQIYASNLTRHAEDPKKTKPLFLFIDEPETFMHPVAQHRFLEALNTISGTRQVFVTTHSPYLLRLFDVSKHGLYVFKRATDKNTALPSNSLALFGKSSPSWGEINYFAYGLKSVEFHNELYGFIQARAVLLDDKNEKTKEFDRYLSSHGVPIDMEWIHEKVSGDERYKVTIQTYIRNSIHHPENCKNITFDDNQLELSTAKLIEILKS